MTLIHTTMKSIKTLALILIIGLCHTAARAQKVYYSMKAGDWSTPATWSYSSSDYQQANEAPGEDDIVYISDADVTISAPDVKAAQVVIITTLKITGGTPVFGEMSGRGFIELHGDYYPTVTTDNYTGLLIVEAEGGNVTLSRNPVNYPNLTLSVGSGVVSINGDITISTLRVTKGDIQLLPGSKLTVFNDIEVNATRKLISSGEGDDSQLIVYGDIYNTGSIDLYQGDSKSHTELVLCSDNRHQVVSIVGTGKFSKITIDKHNTNYYAEILADNTVDLGKDVISLKSGTFVLGSNIKMDYLSTEQFKVNASSVLAIAGADITTDVDIVVEGGLEIRSGKLTCHKQNGGAGLILSELSGNISIEGGKVDVNYLKTADNATGAFHISGGVLELSNYASPAYIKLMSENTVYELAGGEIIFHGSVYSVNSANPIVTGGKVTFYHDVNITGTVPFYSVIIDQCTVSNESASPLEVYGDLVLVASPAPSTPPDPSLPKSTLGCRGKDVYIGGDFTIGDNTVLTEAMNFCFNTAKNTSITGAGSLIYQNFVVDKDGNHSVTVDNTTTVSTLTVLHGILNIPAGKHVSAYDAQNDGVIHGHVYMEEGGNKTISGAGKYDEIYQITVNNLTLMSNVECNKYYFPSGGQGVCDLNSYVLTINEGYENNSTAKFFRNNGDNVSAGLRLKVRAAAGESAGDIAMFPIATNGSHYSPVTISIVSSPTQTVEEYVSFNVVGNQHPCLQGTNLKMYWIANTNNSDANKGCFKYKFQVPDAAQGQASFSNLALMGVDWVVSTNPATMGDANTMEFYNGNYSMPSGDFTAGYKSNADNMTVWYSSKLNDGNKSEYGFLEDKWYKYKNGVVTNEKGHPKRGDVAVIVGNDFINVNASNAMAGIGKLIFLPEGENYGRLLMYTSCSCGYVSGEGTLEFLWTSGTVPQITADLSLFDKEEKSEYFFVPQEKATSINLAHNGNYPNISFEPQNKLAYFTFDNDIVANGYVNIRGNKTMRVTNNIQCGQLRMGGNGTGTLEFRNNNSSVVRAKEIVFATINSSIKVANDFASGSPKLIVEGNINGGGFTGCSITLYKDAKFVPLYFVGNSNSEFVNAGNLTISLAQIVVDKESVDNTVTINKNITFSTSQYGAESDNKTFLLKKGTLIFQQSGSYTLSNSGNDFVIPAESKLIANNGVTLNVTGCTTGITLGGVLTLNDGATLNNEGHLYYKETGKAAITLNGDATFTNKGQFCPDPSSTGKIDLTISQNALVKIGGAACVSTTSHGIFDITSGSSIVMAADASIYFVDGIKNATVPDLTINADDGDCTFGKGSKFVFDNDGISVKNQKFTTYRIDFYENWFKYRSHWYKLMNWHQSVYAMGQVKNKGTNPDNTPAHQYQYFTDKLFADFLANPDDWEYVSEYSPDGGNSFYQNNTRVLNGGTYDSRLKLSTNETVMIWPNQVLETYSLQKRVYTTYKYKYDYFGETSFTLSASTSLPNVIVSNNATVTLGNALTVLEDLTVNGDNGALYANGKAMNLKGDFIVDGTFAAQSNTVKFSGISTQEAKGNKDIVFYNAEVLNQGGNVTFINTDIVENELLIGENSVLKDNGNPITVQTKLTNSGTFEYNTAKNGDGIVLNSGTQDHLITIVSKGSIGKLYIDNAKNVVCANAGEELYINNALTLKQGLLNMGKSTLALGEQVAYIDSVGTNYVTKDAVGNVTAINKMIVFQSSTETNGIKKIFASNQSGKFIMPMGVAGKYAPAIVDVEEINAGATLTITPCDGLHPSIKQDFEYTNWDLDDKANALSFYWKVLSAGTTNFQGSLIFSNDISDYHAPDKDNAKGYHYLAARLLTGKEKWDKLWSNSNSYDKGYITFNSSTMTMDDDAHLSGEYTAGLGDEFGVGAIPGNLDVYVSKGSDFSPLDWLSKDNWYIGKIDNDGHLVWENGKIVKDKDAETPPDAGSIVFVFHNMEYTSSDELKLYRTFLLKDDDISDPGKINIHESTGHNFGYIAGIGTIVTESGAVPNGNYDDFVKPGSGTIEFGGTNDCSIHKSVFNNVVFSGKGLRKLGSDDLIVNGDFKVDGDDATLDIDNSLGATWNIHGNFIYNQGKFSRPAGNGVSIVNMCGSSAQEFTGTGSLADGNGINNSINILQIDNTSLDGVSVRLPVDVAMRVEFYHGVLNTFDDVPFRIINTIEDESQTVLNYNTSRFINGPLTKKILTNGSWTFPVGNHLNNQNKENNRLGNFTVYNFYPGNDSGNGFVTVCYHYTKHPASGNNSLYAHGIVGVDLSEYWTVTPANDGSTFGLKLRWDETNRVGTDPASLANVCITNFVDNPDPDQQKWERIASVAVALTGKTGRVTSTDDRIPHNNAPYTYTLAHTNAITYTWTGEVNENWFVPGNWSGGEVPTISNSVEIKKLTTGKPYPVINSTEVAEAQYLKIYDGASLTISPDSKLTVFAHVVVDDGGKLLLKAPVQAADFKADASGVSRGHSILPAGSLIYNGTFNGEVTFQRFVRGYEWERIAVPLTGFNPAPIATCNSWYLYYYDEAADMNKGEPGYSYTDGLSEGNNSTILASGWNIKTGAVQTSDITKSAYRYLCSKKQGNHVLEFKGKPWTDASQPVKVVANFSDNDTYVLNNVTSHKLDGWNLIPNPYLSAVDADNIEFNNVDATVYIHDNIDNASFAYQKNAGAVGVVTNPAGYTSAYSYSPRYIAAGQSFFVHATPGAAGNQGSVTFTTKSRTHDYGSTSLLLKGGSSCGSGSEQLVFTTSGNGGSCRNVVYFADDATDGFDSEYDAYMLATNQADLMLFYSFGNDVSTPLAANALPSALKKGGEVALGYSATTAGTYTVSLSQNTVSGALVYLYDAQNDTYTELTPGYSFRLTVDKGADNSRFKLVFSINHAPEVVAPIEDVAVMPGNKLEHTIGEVFADNDLYDYVADIEVTSANGGLLPEWLSYDYETGTFSGTPSYNDMGETLIAVTAEDTHGAKSSTEFKITVLNPACPSGSISDINTQSGKFTLDIPDGTFTGFLGTALSYSYTLADGSPLPSFMSFNPTDGSLSCSTSESQAIQLALTVSDAYNNTLTVNFGIVISIPAPEPVVVEPVAPEPVAPEPVTPEPVVPEPVVSEPEVVEPVIVEPVVIEPEPVTPDPVTPEPVTPEPVIPDPVTPEPVTPEPVVPEPVTPEPVVPEPVTPEPVVPEPVTPEPVVPEPVTPEPVTPEPVVIEPVIVEPVTPEPVVVKPVTPEIVTPEPVTPEPVTPEPVIVEPVVVEPSVIEIMPEIPQVDPVETVAEENKNGDERADNSEESLALFDNLIPDNLGGVIVEKDPDVRVYPIPSNGLVTVDLGNLTEETGTVKMMLVAVSGRVIAVKDITDSTIELDLTGRPGVYILRLVTPSKTVVKRVVIQ